MAERRTFGGTLIVTADTVFRPTEGPVVIRGDTLAVGNFGGYTEPGFLGITFRDLGLDADVSVYKRVKLEGSAQAFPSVGLFVASSSVRRLGANQLGLQATLPIVIGLNSRTRLVIEPIFRLSKPRVEHRAFDGWSIDARLNL